MRKIKTEHRNTDKHSKKVKFEKQKQKKQAKMKMLGVFKGEKT